MSSSALIRKQFQPHFPQRTRSSINPDLQCSTCRAAHKTRCSGQTEGRGSYSALARFGFKACNAHLNTVQIAN
ncbi:hypothetical protein RRG08_025580 [Elysia crispata]|uniref:Uncharacterized protein n=1 Tax=Elysia crispata TaxID=231223 RepID=A0AAE0YEB5_9GAST|nr:hypothetical protein RRG08_025580 [Elysia crispata]